MRFYYQYFIMTLVLVVLMSQSQCIKVKANKHNADQDKEFNIENRCLSNKANLFIKTWIKQFQNASDQLIMTQLKDEKKHVIKQTNN
ncbi:UNKNOWN [Stylonychia lemnae]|uniref:Secreted protein n=1 Tax=Stylonychia lemnae TaxID=5949 RepID=A0A078ASJ7_STYLE|nr:UNKNOWN [Stylonychia lemnae]|eukprot:CDW85144.1 UNKNOWN [Stylonychia lemnae]